MDTPWTLHASCLFLSSLRWSDELRFAYSETLTRKLIVWLDYKSFDHRTQIRIPTVMRLQVNCTIDWYGKNNNWNSPIPKNGFKVLSEQYTIIWKVCKFVLYTVNTEWNNFNLKFKKDTLKKIKLPTILLKAKSEKYCHSNNNVKWKVPKLYHWLSFQSKTSTQCKLAFI